jgi:hypothetical protein
MAKSNAPRRTRTPSLLIRSQAERRTARKLEADETERNGAKAREGAPKRGGHSGGSREYRRTVLPPALPLVPRRRFKVKKERQRCDEAAPRRECNLREFRTWTKDDVLARPH